MKKVLLLNLPYKNKKLQRDFSCPHTPKADYYWPSIDLIAYSAILSEQDLYLIDCVQEKIDEEALVEQIKKIKPDYIFTMISSISLEDDSKIIEIIKKTDKNIKICVSGDLASFEPKKVIKTKEIDFVISDFTEKKEIQKIIKGQQKKRIITSSKNNKFSLGVPKHELFKKYNYKLPYSFYKPITSIITNYGCPFKCKFCNSNNLKFKIRNLEEIIDELKYLRKIGIKEAYIRDFTFGVPRVKELLKRMIKEKVKLKWSCEFRVDLVNEEILDLMKKAGCYLIFYGGESGNQRTLDLMNKGFKIEELKKAVMMTKRAKIETLVSFIIGFPTETEKDVENTKKLIMKLNPEYISVNILVPRIGSNFRKEIGSMEGKELDNSEENGMKYPSGKFAIDHKKEIEKSFFFRPGKMMKYLILSIKTINRFENFIKSGFSIFRRIK